jgi:F-type H+-transporting ATPase subunit delta
MAVARTAARRYAEAIFGIAERDRTVEPWLAELEQVAAALGDERELHALQNPAVPMAAREAALESSLGDISRQVRTLVVLLLRRNRLELVGRVVDEYRRLSDRRAGIVRARATSHQPLEPGDVRALTQRLEQMTGGRVELTTDVDPSILGGVIVRLGDQLIDGSVRGRLERLRARLASGALT